MAPFQGSSKRCAINIHEHVILTKKKYLVRTQKKLDLKLRLNAEKEL